MPRRPKAVRRPMPRAEAERGPHTLRESIRARYATEDSRYWLTAHGKHFFAALATPEERWAFAQEFPHEFYEHFNFFCCAEPEEPASTHYNFQVFRRLQSEFLSMLAGHPPDVPFDPPDVSRLHFYPESIEAMARARGKWWRANKWAMTQQERSWLAGEPPPPKKERILPWKT